MLLGGVVLNTKKENIEIGKRIKIARERAGLTQERLAELINMGPKNLSSVERGVVGISITTLQKICKTLSISADQILFDSPNTHDVTLIANKLSRLSNKQYKIANDILNKLIEGFSLSES